MKSVVLFIIENIEFFVAICGGIIALLQWRESNNNHRAEYLDSLLTKLWENKDIQNFILLNDYDKDWYNEDFHRSEDKTIPTLADKTLSFMNYICYVLKVKIIYKREKSLFDYYLSSLALCKDMKRYLFDLYQYSILNHKPFLFSYFLDLCIEEKLLPKSIIDKNYFKYILLDESNNNSPADFSLPNDIQDLKKELGSELFLKTCSRCEHCQFYKNKNCLKDESTEEHFWLPLNQNNPCKSFIFDKNSWKF